MYSGGSWNPLFFVPKIKVSNPKIKWGAPIIYGIFMIKMTLVYKEVAKPSPLRGLRCDVEKVLV